MAVDRIGDMDYLLSIAQPKIGIITDIGVSHLEFFRDEKQILKEKAKMISQIPAGGIGIINYDNFYLRNFKKVSKTPLFSYGTRQGADVQAEDLKIGYAQGLGEGVSMAQGTSFRVRYKTIYLPVSLPNIISEAQVLSALSAISVGIQLGMNLVEITENLRDFSPLPGRMVLLRGKRGNIIIDDTYNSAPNSAKSALRTMALIKSRKKTVILGDMLELGKIEKSAHKELGKIVFPVADKVILVGERTLETHKELRKLGFPKNKIFHFHTVKNLLPAIGKIIGRGEFILVKGSQGMRMEKVVEKLVPSRYHRLLPRQDKYWKRKGVKKV